jgi:nucleoside-triphosphatase
MGRAYLLTGEPQAGKTSAIKKLIDVPGREQCGGFYTEEIRVDGMRKGFRLMTLDGKSGVLAHVDSESSLRIGRYGVNLQCLETLGIPVLYEAMVTKKLVVLDEIGPMELLSEHFKQAVFDLLEGPRPLLGTVALKSIHWLDMMKHDARVELYTLTLSNRDHVVEQLSRSVASFS